MRIIGDGNYGRWELLVDGNCGRWELWQMRIKADRNAIDGNYGRLLKMGIMVDVN